MAVNKHGHGAAQSITWGTPWMKATCLMCHMDLGSQGLGRGI